MRSTWAPFGVAVVAAVAAGAWHLAHRPERGISADPADSSPLASSSPAPGPTRPTVVVRLEPLSADGRSARVRIGDDPLGSIQLDAEGRVSGDALIKLPTRGKRLGTSHVEVTRDPAVDRELALKVQAALFMSGAADSVVVDPPGP